MEYYVYVLLDPRDCYIPFYVGKGKGNRCYDHLTESAKRTSNKRKFSRIAKMRRGGFEPAILIWEKSLAEEDAYRLEETLILRFGRLGIDPGGILDNYCVAARPPGFNHCQDQDAFRKAISEGILGEKNGFYGRTHSEETRAKIGAAHRGKIISEEQRNAISRTNKGVPKSAATRQKMSTAQKGKPKSTEHKAKIGEIHRGKIISTEQREKLRVAMTGRVFSPETKEKLRLAALNREARKRENNSTKPT